MIHNKSIYPVKKPKIYHHRYRYAELRATIARNSNKYDSAAAGRVIIKHSVRFYSIFGDMGEI